MKASLESARLLLWGLNELYYKPNAKQYRSKIGMLKEELQKEIECKTDGMQKI